MEAIHFLTWTRTENTLIKMTLTVSRNHNHKSLTSNRLYFGPLYDDQVYKYSMCSTWQAISPILLDVMAVKSTLQIN